VTVSARPRHRHRTAGRNRRIAREIAIYHESKRSRPVCTRTLPAQFLAAGLVGELVLHLVPVLLKTGTWLFELPAGNPLDLEIIDVVAMPLAAHLHYRLG
jgi:hypothetical protein